MLEYCHTVCHLVGLSIIAILRLSEVSSANILALTPFVGNASQSHAYIMVKLSEYLIAKGHHVVMPLHVHMRTDLSREVEIVQFPSAFTDSEWARNTEYFMPRFVSGDVTISDFDLMLYNQHLECDVMLRDQDLYARLKATSFEYALIDHVFSCGFLYAHRLSLPFIVLECGGHQSTIADTIDPFPLSYVPVMFSGFTDRMTFLERFSNLYRYYLALMFSGVMFRYHDGIGTKLGILNRGQTIAGLKGQAQLWVLNQAWYFDFPRPLLPHVIMAGGLLTRPPRALSSDLEDVVNAAEAGIIVVSFGSYVDISVMENFQRTLIEAFSRLPQVVVWATKRPPYPLPPNIRVFDWIPQNDLLGHSKTKACVLHGGINGIYEAVYHGVPTLVLAVAFDATDNAVRLMRRGAGLFMKPRDVTPEGVQTALLELVHNKSYKENAVRLSAIMKDQPASPAEKASFWIDHVIRHGGSYLRPAGNDLSVIELYMLDVHVINLFILLAFLWVIYKLFVICMRHLWSKLYKRKKD